MPSSQNCCKHSLCRASSSQPIPFPTSPWKSSLTNHPAMQRCNYPYADWLADFRVLLGDMILSPLSCLLLCCWFSTAAMKLHDQGKFYKEEFNDSRASESMTEEWRHCSRRLEQQLTARILIHKEELDWTLGMAGIFWNFKAYLGQHTSSNKATHTRILPLVSPFAGQVFKCRSL